MDRVVPTGRHHLDHGTNHHLLGNNGVRTKRVSVPNGRPIGVAQAKRVSVTIGSQMIGTAQMKSARLRHGSHRSHGSE